MNEYLPLNVEGSGQGLSCAAITTPSHGTYDVGVDTHMHTQLSSYTVS